MTRAPTYPSAWRLKVRTDGGRSYRLFERAGKRWRCRACGARLRRETLERHAILMIATMGSEADLARRLAQIALRRRKDMWRKRTQYYHEKARKRYGVDL